MNSLFASGCVYAGGARQTIMAFDRRKAYDDDHVAIISL